MQDVLEKKSIKNIDFNCDLAQAYGVYKNKQEFELLDYVSSVNISCGFHAGDPVTIKEALLKAKEKNVAIGAHIGFNGIQGFGYRPVELKEDELEALVIYQVGAIMSFAKASTFNRFLFLFSSLALSPCTSKKLFGIKKLSASRIL